MYPTNPSSMLRHLFLTLAIACGISVPAWPAPTLDNIPRVAIMSAFGEELNLLMNQVSEPQKHTVNGITFTTGKLQGRPVVLLLSGISMTNAAMTTQLALDRFNVTHIVFSGIAGGVNPALQIGDVTVADQWGQYLEVLLARETEPAKYAPPPWMDDVKLPNFGMMYPRPVGVRSARGSESRFWFPVDPKLLEIAKRVGETALAKCDPSQQCLGHQPKVVVGGNGVSGQAFVDNAAFRAYAFKTFRANVLDMETAAVAHVAYSNGVPFIAFRSLSDLAGGGTRPNEIEIFMKTAADNSAKVLLAFFAAWPAEPLAK
jgi:adenosylhomocysteine nucleosidase